MFTVGVKSAGTERFNNTWRTGGIGDLGSTVTSQKRKAEFFLPYMFKKNLIYMSFGLFQFNYLSSIQDNHSKVFYLYLELFPSLACIHYIHYTPTICQKRLFKVTAHLTDMTITVRAGATRCQLVFSCHR